MQITQEIITINHIEPEEILKEIIKLGALTREFKVTEKVEYNVESNDHAEPDPSLGKEGWLGKWGALVMKSFETDGQEDPVQIAQFVLDRMCALGQIQPGLYIIDWDGVIGPDGYQPFNP